MAAGGLAVTVRPLRLGRRDGVSVVIRGPATTEAELESLYATLAASVADRGLGLADVVRSRLVVTSRAARDAASLVRRRHLAGPARCATSSYIDGSGRPRLGTARIATIALHGAGGDKVVGEYDPPEVPCRFVESRGLVFLSGVTSAAEALGTQLDDVRARLAANLAAASDRLGRPVRPAIAVAYLDRWVEIGGGDRLAGRVGLSGVPLTIRRCDGFSKPACRLEVEVDAIVTS